MSKKIHKATAKVIEGEIVITKGEELPQPEKPVVVVHDTPSDRMLAVIDKASTDPRCNVEKMRALLDMKMELVRDDRRMCYNRAMKAAQEEMKPIVRMAQNEKKKYAKLEHIDNAIRPIYSEHGFSLSFNSRKEADNTVTMICDVLHEDGHSEQKELNAARDLTGAKGSANKTDVQGVGSTVSYLRRYLTMMVFNVTLIDEDDDGAGGKIEKKPDRFAGERQDGGKQQPTPAQPLSLGEAADRLEKKLRDEVDRSKRGDILMKHIKVVGALEDAGQTEKAADIRKLAEEKVDE